MASRALIIAIEDYSAVTAGGLTQQLTGTLDAGKNFMAWLQAKWKAENKRDTDLTFCSEPKLEGHHGAKAADILDALAGLRDRGTNSTHEMFFFFSGHGFCFVERPGRRSDVIIASDYVSPDRGASSCFNLSEIEDWLRDHLGNGDHYYFIDACRNRIGSTQITVGNNLPTCRRHRGWRSVHFQASFHGAGSNSACWRSLSSATLERTDGRRQRQGVGPR